VIPYVELERHVANMWTTKRGDKLYWHVKIEGRNGKYSLLLRQGEENPDISLFMLAHYKGRGVTVKVSPSRPDLKP